MTTAVRRPPRIIVEPWGAFRDTASGAVPMLVADLLPASSLAFLSSPPKSGKTWLSLALAISIASGRPYLGRFAVPEPAPVLYLALEGSRAALRARIGALSRGIGLDPDSADLRNLHVAYRPAGINLSSADWADELVLQAEHVDAALVIVDVLRRAANVRETGDGAADFADLMRNLSGIADQRRGLLFCHHFSKGGASHEGRSNGDKMAGSGALFAAADVALHIVRSDENARFMQIEADARDLRPPKPFGVELAGDLSDDESSFVYESTAQLRAVDSRPMVRVLADRIVELLDDASRDGRKLTQTDASAVLATSRFKADFRTAWTLAQELVKARDHQEDQ